jgi:hypothetical protein
MQRSVAGLTSPNGDINLFKVKQAQAPPPATGFAVKTEGTNMIKDYLSNVFEPASKKDEKRQKLLSPSDLTPNSRHPQYTQSVSEEFSINDGERKGEAPTDLEEGKVIQSYQDTDEHDAVMSFAKHAQIDRTHIAC